MNVQMAGRGFIPMFIANSFAKRNKTFVQIRRNYRNSSSNFSPHSEPQFGLFFDIDGVIVRGRRVLPGAREAFQLLTDDNGKFKVPTIFVTNAGNCLRQKKADQLRDWLNIEVDAEQVIMSHSPLKCFRQFLNKHVLVSGQGPVEDIAKNLGFTNVTTMETMCKVFPKLDMVDHNRRAVASSPYEKDFPRIEAVILFGEPVRWETNLQLLLDVLVTNGHPSEAPGDIVYPHIPVLACNMDLMWMSEAPMPRFAHGCFLHCLESLYHKVTGCELKYTALVGKPSELTYHHSELMLQEQAEGMGIGPIKRMYCIGDNPDADIYGANLYNRYIQNKREKLASRKQKVRQSNSLSNPEYDEEMITTASRTYSIEDADRQLLGVTECKSMLVCTGVFSAEHDYDKKDSEGKVVSLLNHNHRDFIMDSELKRPSQTVPNVLEAVKAIFKNEGVNTTNSS